MMVSELKIKDFVRKLSEFNQDADITTPFSEDITLSYICKSDDGTELSKKTTHLVFIEPCDECPNCVHQYVDCEERMCSFYDKPCKEVEECYQFESADGYD